MMTARATQSEGPWWRGLAAAGALSLFLSFTDPFGATADLPGWAGFLYWSALAFEAWYGLPLVAAAIRRVAPASGETVCRVAATPILAAGVWVTILLVQALRAKPVPVAFWPTLYGLVLGVSVAIAALQWLFERAFATGKVTHASPGAAADIRFLQRVPAKLRGAELYAVSAEDHYLRLHTSQGSDLIRMRMADALLELEGLEGAQVHRSWWVARSALEDVRRDGAKLTLVLKNGVEAPVSRSNIRPLREGGWFA